MFLAVFLRDKPDKATPVLYCKVNQKLAVDLVIQLTTGFIMSALVFLLGEHDQKKSSRYLNVTDYSSRVSRIHSFTDKPA